MLNRKEHLLVIAAEEASEVAQEVSKCLRFGPDEKYENDPLCRTNAERVVDEFNDLVALMYMLESSGVIPMGTILNPTHVLKKQAKVERFMRYSRMCGTLEAKSDG